MQGHSSTRFVSVAPKLGARPAFDGLRGIGVSLVVLGHAIYEMIPSLAPLVDMFFILSGFLITTLLLEEDRKRDTIDLKGFYKRRARRLLPMLYIVILVTFGSLWLLSVIHGGSTEAPFADGGTYGDLVDMAISDGLAAGTYVYHVVHPVGIELVNGTMPDPRPLVPLWSLSVEEHYYVIGVLLTILVIKRRWVKPAVAVIAGIVLFIGVARALGHVGPRLAWYQRPDALLLGVGLAFVNAHLPAEWSQRHAKGLRRGITLGLVGWVAVVFTGTVFAKVADKGLEKVLPFEMPFDFYIPFHPIAPETLAGGLFWPRFGFTLANLCSVAIIFGLARTSGHPAEKFLSGRLTCALGRRSYGIYIIHFPLGMIMMNLFPTQPAIGALLYLPALYGTTELAHRYLEKPLMAARIPTKAPTVDLRDTAAPAPPPQGADPAADTAPPDTATAAPAPVAQGATPQDPPRSSAP